MFHACVARFDVTGNLKKIYKIFWVVLKKNLRFSIISNLAAHV